MYSVLPSFVLGFHGCDREVARRIVNKEDKLKSSTNNYDWLGNGIYFWENSPERALNYAKMLKSNPGRVKGKVENPEVLGAILDLGHCLNFLDEKWLSYLKLFYQPTCDTYVTLGKSLPQNKPIGKQKDLLLRELDCTMIQNIHKYRKSVCEKEFDSVRGVFWEGDELYPNAGFKENNHIQICVRNPNCIKGYFFPLEKDDNWAIP